MPNPSLDLTEATRLAKKCGAAFGKLDWFRRAPDVFYLALVGVLPIFRAQKNAGLSGWRQLGGVRFCVQKLIVSFGSASSRYEGKRLGIPS